MNYKEKQMKLKVIRRKKITKIIAEINEIQAKIIFEKTNETENKLFEQINEVHKALPRLNRKKQDSNK